MKTLSDTDKTALQDLFKLSNSACEDLYDSIDTGLMCDSKSAVHAVLKAVETLPLPEEITTPLHTIALEARQGVASADDTYHRCAKALAALGRLEKLINNMLAT